MNSEELRVLAERMIDPDMARKADGDDIDTLARAVLSMLPVVDAATKQDNQKGASLGTYLSVCENTNTAARAFADAEKQGAE